MSPKNIIGILMLAGGMYLLNFGVNGSHSYNSENAYYIVGHFTSDNLWCVIGGAIGMVLGLIILLAGFRGKPAN